MRQQGAVDVSWLVQINPEIESCRCFYDNRHVLLDQRFATQPGIDAVFIREFEGFACELIPDVYCRLDE